MKKVLLTAILSTVVYQAYALDTHAQAMFDDYNYSTNNYAHVNEYHATENPNLLQGRQVEIGSGNNYACEMTLNGEAKCWGFNKLGEVPTQEQEDILAMGDYDDFKHVEEGSDFNCALDDGDDIYCWGSNERGQLGTDTDDTHVAKPLKVDAGVKFDRIYTKDHYACALDKDLHAYCWGDGSSGEVGNGQKGYFKTPQKVKTDVQFSRLSMSTTFTCGIEKDTNDTYCWGKGVGGSTQSLDSSVPVKI